MIHKESNQIFIGHYAIDAERNVRAIPYAQMHSHPIAAHNRAIHDFCSYCGLVILSGVANNAPADNPHILRSTDGKTALRAGSVDDLWNLGKARGKGGPWKDRAVKAVKPPILSL